MNAVLLEADVNEPNSIAEREKWKEYVMLLLILYLL